MDNSKPRSFSRPTIWGTTLLLLAALSTVIFLNGVGSEPIMGDNDGSTSQKMENETILKSAGETMTIIVRDSAPTEPNIPKLSLTLSVIDVFGAALPEAMIRISLAERSPIVIGVDENGMASFVDEQALTGVVYAVYDQPAGVILRSRPLLFELGQTGHITLTVEDSTCCLYGFVRKGDVGAEGFTTIAASKDLNKRELTDSKGFFLIDGLPGNFPIQVYCINGRQKFYHKTLSLEPGEARRLDITLGSGDILLNLLAWTTEIGDSDIQIELNPLDPREALTGTSSSSPDNARAKFIAVPPGEYLIRVSPSREAQTSFAPSVYPVTMKKEDLTFEIPLAKPPFAVIHIETGNDQHAGSVEYWFILENGTSTKQFRRAQRAIFSPEAPLEVRPPLGACRLMVRSNQYGLGAINLTLMPGERQEYSLTLSRDFPKVSFIMGSDELPRGWLLLQDQEGRVEATIAPGGGTFVFRTSLEENPVALGAKTAATKIDFGLVMPGRYRVVFANEIEFMATDFQSVSVDTIFKFE